eukprot:scaffold34212_cov84-Isochrysis_galbana.AAC.1
MVYFRRQEHLGLAEGHPLASEAACRHQTRRALPVSLHRPRTSLGGWVRRKPEQHLKLGCEGLKRHPDGVPHSRDSDRLEHPGGRQLRLHQRRIEVCRRFGLVGFDAPHIGAVRGRDQGQHVGQLLPKPAHHAAEAGGVAARIAGRPDPAEGGRLSVWGWCVCEERPNEGRLGLAHHQEHLLVKGILVLL